MTRIILSIIAVFLLSGFSVPTPLKKVKDDYLALRESIEKERIQTAHLYTEHLISMEEVGHIFTDNFVTNIIPQWIGTPWSQDGKSFYPQQGSINDSYFVMTTLLHMGIRLNRYDYARKSALKQAETIKLEHHLINYQGSSDSFFKECQTHYDYGIYFLTIEDYVGFLYIDKDDEFYFIYTSHTQEEEQVIMKNVEECSFLKGDLTATMVPISTNYSLMEYWLSNKNIP
ncbi:hypothetical protein [Algivirga pacifica]|uniref:DUF4919 domain-containing protein n=1 Tax=Algivirga pacifica TaxID=1162670 RepID=A0ABP9DP95_9BACT